MWLWLLIHAIISANLSLIKWTQDGNNMEYNQIGSIFYGISCTLISIHCACALFGVPFAAARSGSLDFCGRINHVHEKRHGWNIKTRVKFNDNMKLMSWSSNLAATLILHLWFCWTTMSYAPENIWNVPVGEYIVKIMGGQLARNYRTRSELLCASKRITWKW